MPTPNDGEKKEAFISRCVKSQEIKSRYRSPDSRVNACYEIWRNARPRTKADIEAAISASIAN